MGAAAHRRLDGLPLGNLCHQRQRVVPPGPVHGAVPPLHLERQLAAAPRHRLPGGLYHLLDLRVREHPTADGRQYRAGAAEPGRQRRGRVGGGLARHRGGASAARLREGGDTMKIQGPAKLIRIYIGETDQWHGQPLYNAIVQRAKREGLAGATVTRGIEGFGANSRIHTANILRLSEDLPVKIEIVDIAERIERFLPLLEEMVTEGMITIQECEIIKYVHTPRS